MDVKVQDIYIEDITFVFEGNKLYIEIRHLIN